MSKANKATVELSDLLEQRQVLNSQIEYATTRINARGIDGVDVSDQRQALMQERADLDAAIQAQRAKTAQAEREALERKASKLRQKEDEAIQDAFNKLLALDKAIDDLGDIQQSLWAKYQLPGKRGIIKRKLIDDVKHAVRDLKGWHPELF